MRMKLEVTEKIEKRDEDEIFQGLLAYNLPRLEDKEPKDLGVYFRDERGRLQGGLTGSTHGSWLFIFGVSGEGSGGLAGFGVPCQ